ncbi:alpha/beta hydrolase [Oceanobacillus picturae]|uniref:alpha/beta hydrolase n=1 Tax=Oceanobacillus picturae TaxID=171693 RepID=UPI0036377562
MALFQCEFSSEVLSRSVSMNVILPQPSFKDEDTTDKKYPTLFLLHGFSDNHTAYLRTTSIERYAADKGLAIVMPGLDNSYYTDMAHGGKYWTFLTEELPAAARSFFPLSEKREDNFVAGHSMGGFGALKWALNFPDRFAAVASMSGVTDMVYHLANVRKEPGDKKRSLELVFGEADVSKTENDLIYKLERLNESSSEKPMLYQSCGTEDFLYEHNLRFHRICKETDLDYTYDFGPGDHTWEYWDDKIQDILKWLPIR